MAPTASAGKQDAGDPSAMYGHCDPTSGVRSKSEIVRQAQPSSPTLGQIESIYVLNCGTFNGGGGVSVVPCPSSEVPRGLNLSYCVQVNNDGVGNYALLGVVVNKNLPCQQTGQSRGHFAQIDITFQDPAFGIQTIEFRGSQTNVQTNFYFAGNDSAPIVLSATKVNQGQPSSLTNILVTNAAGIVTTCGPYSF